MTNESVEMNINVNDISQLKEVNQKEKEKEKEKENHEVKEENELDITGDRGILKKILKEGDGTIAEINDQVEVHYVGTLADGTKFDSSRDRGTPFKFNLGRGDVIKGWDLGVHTMKLGEKSLFTIKPEYGYGTGGAGASIPPNATLTFEIELLKFGPAPKNKWEQTFEEKLSSANQEKEDGNEAFKRGDIITAISHYKEALEYFEANEEWPTPYHPKKNAIQLSLHLNLSNSYLKTEQYTEAINQATSALNIEKDNSKAYYRRALANMNFGYLDQCKADLLIAIKLEPNNSEIRREYAKCKKKLLEIKEKEKSTYGNLFNKGSFYKE